MVQKVTEQKQPAATVVVRAHIPTTLHRTLKKQAKDRGYIFSAYIAQLIEEGAERVQA